MRKLMTSAVVAAALAGSIAQAATTTTTFSVTANVQPTCSVTASPLAFGNYNPGAGAVTGTSAVSVRCTNGTAYTVALNGGSTVGGTIAQRQMANGANRLNYNLFTSNAHTTIWGDGTTGSTQAGTGAGVATANAHTVFGQLPDSAVNQASVTGAFSDTVTVTVTY
jgi:spore coat protein U-like protein